MIYEGPDSLPSLHEIVRELVSGLPAELSDPNASNREWTKAICAGLIRFGKLQQDIMVCCHGSSDQGEWVLDVVWFAKQTHQIVLAVESEWGKPEDVQDDFDKLMNIKARRKLLLFGTKIESERQRLLALIEESMKSYPCHTAGEEYMLVDFQTGGAFQYAFSVPLDGELNSINFAAAPEPLIFPWTPKQQAASRL